MFVTVSVFQCRIAHYYCTPAPLCVRRLPPCLFLSQGRYGLKRGLKHYTECQLCPEGLVCEIEGANDLEYEQHKCKDDDDLLVDCQASLCPNDAVCGMGMKSWCCFGVVLGLSWCSLGVGSNIDPFLFELFKFFFFFSFGQAPKKRPC